MADMHNREKQITKTSIIGILANVGLAGFKALAGLISGSISIILDAVNNLTDAMSSIITIAGIKLAKRRPDEKHPYGYGRIEYFSAILIACIVLAAGVTSLVESVKKIIHPEVPEYTLVTVIIVVVAVGVKIVLGKYVSAQGEKYNSDALVASGADASFDAIISASTLIGAVVTYFFHISVDGIIGAVISLFIVKAGMEMLLESTGSIVGNRADSEITKAIKSRVAGMEDVLGAYDLVLHNYGPDKAIGSIHVEVEESMTAEDLHKLTRKIQTTIGEEFHVFLTVGFYAVDKKHDEIRKSIREFALKHEGVLGVHGVFVDDEKKYITFDMVTDFSVHDKEAMGEVVKGHVATLLPGYQVLINYDTNYSD